MEQGENKITMKFSPDYWKVSLIITGFGVALLVLIFLFEYKRGKVMKKVLAKANFTAESSEKATTPVINDTTDTTDEPLRIYRPDNDDDEKLRHINEMMKIFSVRTRIAAKTINSDGSCEKSIDKAFIK